MICGWATLVAQLLQYLSTGPQVRTDRTVEAITSGYLGGNISRSAHDATEPMFDTLDSQGPVKVDESQTAAVDGNQDVIRFQIHVRHAMLVHEVDRFEGPAVWSHTTGAHWNLLAT